MNSELTLAQQMSGHVVGLICSMLSESVLPGAPYAILLRDCLGRAVMTKKKLRVTRKEQLRVTRKKRVTMTKATADAARATSWVKAGWQLGSDVARSQQGAEGRKLRLEGAGAAAASRARAIWQASGGAARSRCAGEGCRIKVFTWVDAAAPNRSARRGLVQRAAV